MNIQTSFVYPPIPVRDFDWQAHVDGYEPGDALGHGATAPRRHGGAGHCRLAGAVTVNYAPTR